MAFMMPVMKNNYDIYKDSRSRKTSECSNASSNGGGGVGGSASVSAAMGTPTGRSRKVSECKSESFATSPSHHHPHHGYRMQMQRCQSSRGFPRNSSRTSHSSASGALSPTRSFCQASSPPKTMAVRNTNTQNNNNNNNNNSSSNNNNNNNNNNNTSGSQSDFTKFHLRLVDKLRKSFRKDTAKRS